MKPLPQDPHELRNYVFEAFNRGIEKRNFEEVDALREVLIQRRRGK